MNSLDAEERDLLESFVAGDWESLPGRETEIKRYRDIARATFKKEMRVNIRLSSFFASARRPLNNGKFDQQKFEF